MVINFVRYPFLVREIFEKDIATILNAILTAPFPKGNQDNKIKSKQKSKDMTDDYEVILSDKSPRKSEGTKTQQSFEENKYQDDQFEDISSKPDFLQIIQMVLDNSSELKNSLSNSGRYKGIIPPKHKPFLNTYSLSWTLMKNLIRFSLATFLLW